MNFFLEAGGFFNLTASVILFAASSSGRECPSGENRVFFVFWAKALHTQSPFAKENGQETRGVENCNKSAILSRPDWTVGQVWTLSESCPFSRWLISDKIDTTTPHCERMCEKPPREYRRKKHNLMGDRFASRNVFPTSDMKHVPNGCTYIRAQFGQ